VFKKIIYISFKANTRELKGKSQEVRRTTEITSSRKAPRDETHNNNQQL
jgi:hypothetical protein